MWTLVFVVVLFFLELQGFWWHLCYFKMNCYNLDHFYNFQNIQVCGYWCWKSVWYAMLSVYEMQLRTIRTNAANTSISKAPDSMATADLCVLRLPSPHFTPRLWDNVLNYVKFFRNTSHESNATMLYEFLLPRLGKDHVGWKIHITTYLFVWHFFALLLNSFILMVFITKVACLVNPSRMFP